MSVPRPEDTIVRSLAEYLDKAGEIGRRWPDNGGYITPWWRGHSDASWLLTPSLYREPKDIRTAGQTASLTLENERGFLRDFKLHGSLLADPRPSSDVEWYFLMRHHLLPVRVLDWSENPLIALWFAISGTDYSKDAAIWALNPGRMNRDWHGEWIKFADDQVIETYLPDRIAAAQQTAAQLRNMASVPPAHLIAAPKVIAPEVLAVARAYTVNYMRPIAAHPTDFTHRVVAQKSRFTIHGICRRDLATQLGQMATRDVPSSPYLRKITIPSEYRRDMAEELHLKTRITEDVLYPDLDGLARALGRAYRFKLQ